MLLAHITQSLGIDAQTTFEGFLDHIEASGMDCFDGLLLSEDARHSALELYTASQGYTIRLVKQLAPIQNRFCKVRLDGEALPVLVAMLDGSSENLPTDMESLIVLAIVHGQLFDMDWWEEGHQGKQLKWRGKKDGFALVAEPPKIKSQFSHNIAAIFGFQDAGYGLDAAPSSGISSASELVLSSAEGFSVIQSRLLFEATTVTHPKWKFLSLYRILENSYLKNIKDTLLRDFDKDASHAVDSAQNKLSSELNQLIDLMNNSGLKEDFELFNEEFEKQKGAFNRYIVALDRGAEKEQKYKSKDIAEKAVLRFYKIRCSIAHAGTSGVIYEQLPDANVGVSALLPAVERIVHKSLGIRLP